jgi:hypothetical protein
MNYYINYLKEKDLLKRIPVYFAFGLYIFKYHKFPYFMDMYRTEKNVSKVFLFILGIHGIDIIFNLYLISNEKKKNNSEK